MKKYPEQIKFDLKGIYVSVFLILLSSLAFIYYGQKFQKDGHLYVLLFVYALLAVYLFVVFIRTWWPALRFKQDYILDNHRLLAFSRKIYRNQIESFELKDKYTKRGESRFIEIVIKEKSRPFLLLDDRLDCTIDELQEFIEDWYKVI